VQFNSFRLRLSLVVIVIFVPILILMYWVEESHRAQLIQDAQYNALTLTESLANDYRQYIESGRQLLSLLAQLPIIRSKDVESCNALLTNLLRENKIYGGIFVVDTQTNLGICSGTPYTTRVSNASFDWYKDVLSSRDFAVSAYRIGPQTGKPVVTMGYPVLDDRGQITAVAAASLSLQWLNAFVENTDIPDNAALTVVDGQGIVLVRYPERPELIGQPMPIESVRQAVLANGRGLTQSPDLEGLPRIYAYTSIAPGYGNIHVILSVPENLILADANMLRQQSLMVLGIIIALGALGAWLTGSIIIRPISDLKRTIQRIASGELSSRTELRAETTELQGLSLAFNEMADAIESRMAAQVDQLSTMNQERARLLEAEQRARERAENTINRLELLQELTAHSSAALEPTQVADIITRELPEGVGAHIGLAYVPSGDRQRLINIMTFGASNETVAPYRDVPLTQSIPVSDAFISGKPTYFVTKEDYLAKYPHMAETQAFSGTQAAIALPLIIGGETIGAMLVSFPNPRAFSDPDIAFFQATAQQCAQALQRVLLLQAERRARQEAEQTAEDIALLQAVTEALGAATTMKDVARITLEQTAAALDTTMGNFYLYDEAHDTFEMLQSRTSGPREILSGWRQFPADPAYPLAQNRAAETGHVVRVAAGASRALSVHGAVRRLFPRGIGATADSGGEPGAGDTQPDVQRIAHVRREREIAGLFDCPPVRAGAGAGAAVRGSPDQRGDPRTPAAGPRPARRREPDAVLGHHDCREHPPPVVAQPRKGAPSARPGSYADEGRLGGDARAAMGTAARSAGEKQPGRTAHPACQRRARAQAGAGLA
jgi:GAF domain-containing protein/HAMP domain-containing protein